MKKFKAIFSTLFLLTVCFNLSAQNAREQALITKTLGEVSASKNASDSIKALFNLYDISPKKNRAQIARQIYGLAKKTGNTDVRIDILRLLSTNFEEDQPLSLIEKELNSIPQSSTRDQAVLFVKMRRLMYKARKLSEDERQKEIIKILKSFHSHKSGDLLQQILDLYTVVLYLRNDATGDMLKEYVDKLIELANSPEITLNAIKNLVYSEATNIYSDAEDYNKAVATNRTLLNVINQLEKEYNQKGRPYKNFEVSKYLIYRRMLRNAKGLQPGEAQQFYNMALQLAEQSSDIKLDMDKNPRIHAYYYMAIGDYNSALPVLKEVTSQSNTLPTSKRFIEMLIEAADKTGDDKTRLEAMTKYISLLNQLSNLKAAEKSRELQISYDLRDLKERNEKLETENKEQVVSSERNIMSFVSVAFVIIFIVLLCMLYNWGRYRRNTSRMGQVVDNLHHERHRLRDNLYKDNYDIDPLAREEKYNELVWEKRIKERGMNLGDATIFMTESIVNDLLYIAWVGHKNLLQFIVTTGADAIMRNAETKAGERINKNVELSIEYPENDIEFETDADCLSTLFGHIFVVCTNFKPTSKVTMSCEKKDDGNIDFTITLEGAPPASAEGVQIFKDMPISDILLTYENSGLYICRMIALLLQCELIPDKTYEAGARYILRVPLKIEV